MICFFYVHDTLGLHNVDKELEALLGKTIEERMDTTDEERCAEKSLLAMFLHRPQQLFILMARYHEQLNLCESAGTSKRTN